MSVECKEFCSEHYGCKKEISFNAEQISELKLKLENLKGQMEGRLASVNNDIKDINEKLRKEMAEMNEKLRLDIKEQMGELKAQIKTLSDSIGKKEENNITTKNNRFNTYLSSGILPTVVVIIGFVLQHYFGK